MVNDLACAHLYRVWVLTKLEGVLNDQQAIARLKRGDINGLSALITRYQVRAIRTAYLITQDAALAEDVVQDAFVNAYHAIRSFDARRPFSPWFMRAVVNGAIKAVRRTNVQLSLDEDDGNDNTDSISYLADPTPEPDYLIETLETEEIVWKALGMLSAEHRAIIVLRFYLDMNETEMAEQLNVPVGTVKSRLHSAKRHVRQWLAHQGQELSDE